jgi:hypothetical protein
VYRLDEGVSLNDFLPFLHAIGAMTLLEEVHGAAIQFVVPAKKDMAVAADARAQAAAGEDLAVGRRVHTVRLASVQVVAQRNISYRGSLVRLPLDNP